MKGNRALTFLLIVSTLLFLVTLRGDWGNFNNLQNPMTGVGNPAFESPHERSSYVLLMSLLYHHSVSLTKPLADFGFNDIGVHQGKLYSLFPPGVVVAILPLFLIGTLFGGGQLAAYFTVVLVALTIVFLLFRISVDVFKLSPWTAAATAFIFAFGTTGWSYSVTIYQHIFTVFLMLAGFYAVYLFKKSGEGKWIMAAGAAYCASIFFDYTNLVLLFPVLAYLFVSLPRSRRLLPIAILCVACILPAIYNTYVFGNWSTMSNPLPVYKLASTEELSRTDMVHHALARFHPGAFFRGVNTLLTSWNSGMLVFSPILLIGVFAVLHLMIKKREELRVEHLFFIVTVLINIFLYSFFDDPAGGMSYGPRYMIPSMACLSLFVGQWLDQEGRENEWSVRIKALVVFVLFSISSFVALLGALVTNMIPYTDPHYVATVPRAVTYTFNALSKGRSGSFFYQTFVAHHMTLPVLFALIYLATLVSFCYILLKVDFERKT